MEQPQPPDRVQSMRSAEPTDQHPEVSAVGATTEVPQPTRAPASLTPVAWLRQSAIYLLIMTAIVAWLYSSAGVESLGRALLVLFLLGLILFIHVLGHFLAAKWCKVRVRTLSFDFGPALPGLSFQGRETLYKFSIVPLAGYVTIVGRGKQAAEDQDDPRSLQNKSFAVRLLIVSAGIAFNVLAGFLCFFLVYLFHGIGRAPGVIARVEAGSVAWKAGVRSDSTIKQIGSVSNPWFDHLKVEVALSKPGQAIPFVFQNSNYPNGLLEVNLEPRKGRNDPFLVIGVTAPNRLRLPPREAARNHELPVSYDSPAAYARRLDLGPGDVVLKASDPARGGALSELPHDVGRGTFDAAQLCVRMISLGRNEMKLEVLRANGKREVMAAPAVGFEFGDSIVGTTDPDTPDRPFNIKDLPVDEELTKNAGERACDVSAFRKRLRQLAAEPMVIQLIRDRDRSEARVNLLVPPAFHWALGVCMEMGGVTAVRDDSPAVRAGMQPVGDQVPRGDRLKKLVVEYSDGNKRAGKREIPMEDPICLPFELARAARERPVPDQPVTVRVTVLRPNPGMHRVEDRELVMRWDDSWDFQEEDPLYVGSPMSIPQLGIAYRVQATVAEVKHGSAAARAGLQKNDVFEAVSLLQGGSTIDQAHWTRFFDLKSARGPEGREVYDCWPHCFWMLQRGDHHAILARVRRGERLLSEPVILEGEQDPTWPLEDRGLLLAGDYRLHKADGVMEALGLGLDRTWTFLGQMWRNLRGLVNGRVSTQTLGGPAELVAQTSVAADEPYVFLLWLGMISLYLAFINILPLPLLDGRDLVVLACEKVAGKRLSQSLRTVITFLGWALIGAILLYTFYLDVKQRILAQ